jgi:hypothetical protein
MSINENDRLDLRQELERIFKNPRLAEIAMEAMPPLDYAQLATKQDLGALEAELRGDLAGLRGEMAELRGDMHQINASSVRMMVAGQIVTIGVLGAWITAVT